jgi:hypothetical protein
MFEVFKHLEERPLIVVGGPYHCHHATIKISYSINTPKARELACRGKIGYADMALVTDKVRIEVYPATANREKFSITVKAAEAVKILGPSFPSEESLYQVMCEVYERKNYPIPEPGIPGGGGKSMTAQGQTKKPDAHSHKKHH